MEKIEFLILRNLIYNEEYARKVIPFIKDDYFEDQKQRIIFEEISSFIQQYNKLATKEILSIEVENRSDINDTIFAEIVDCTRCILESRTSPHFFRWYVSSDDIVRMICNNEWDIRLTKFKC